MDVSRTKYRMEQMHQSFEACLQHFAFNKSGTVLVTAVIRSRLTESELKTDLRFFDSYSTDRNYELNSEILDPHKSVHVPDFDPVTGCAFRGDIASLCYSPADDMAVSSSRRGSFKIWTPCSKERRSTWKCKAVGSYKGQQTSIETYY